MSGSQNNQRQTTPSPAPPRTDAEAAWGSVPCQYGISMMSLPIAGMRFGDIKPVLKQLFNLPPDAVAVINGRIVSEDDIIGDGVESLNFIKPPHP